LVPFGRHSETTAALGERGYILAAAGTFAPLQRLAADSLLRPINSLLSRIEFAVVVELIPCSAAQGISSRRSCKLLNSHIFSGRFFVVIDGF